MTKAKAMRDTPTEAMTRAGCDVAKLPLAPSNRALVSRIYTAMQAARSETPVQDDDAELGDELTNFAHDAANPMRWRNLASRSALMLEKLADRLEALEDETEALRLGKQSLDR